MLVKTLECEQVVKIHDLLSREAKVSGDPIHPPGLRSRDLLESSVHIQKTGMYGTYKYTCPLHNAMALTYSLTTSHAFHNGNKRTALVSMLAHLDRNNFVLKEHVEEIHLFCLFISCASHRLDEFMKCKNLGDIENLRKKIENSKIEGIEREPLLQNIDKEVALMHKWILKNARTFSIEERKITFKQLQEILARYDFKVSYDHRRRLMNFSKKKDLFDIIFGGESANLPMQLSGNEQDKLSLKDVQKIRHFLQLTDNDGIDSKAFYEGSGISLDPFIKKYRKVLNELAKY